jgi:hypothetical protein
VESDGASDEGRRRRRIAGHHHGAHTQCAQLRDQRRRIRPRRVAERDDSRKTQGCRRTHGDRQNSETLSLELGDRRGRNWLGLCETDDNGKGSLDDMQMGTTRIHLRRLGHLRGRIEWHERQPFRLIGGRLARGGRANGGIDRILPGVRAGQRRQAQDVSHVEAGQRTDGCHRQLIPRQRTRLIRAQDINGCRIVHGREARRQNALVCQSSGSDRRRKSKSGR